MLLWHMLVNILLLYKTLCEHRGIPEAQWLNAEHGLVTGHGIEKCTCYMAADDVDVDEGSCIPVTTRFRTPQCAPSERGLDVVHFDLGAGPGCPGAASKPCCRETMCVKCASLIGDKSTVDYCYQTVTGWISRIGLFLQGETWKGASLGFFHAGRP